MNNALRAILKLKRPMGGAGEAGLKRHISWMARDEGLTVKEDESWLLVQVGTSDVLFVAHLDTVHTRDGAQEIISHGGIVRLRHASDECLGADDGAGVFLLLELIKARIPGHYAFFCGEERGAIGARSFHADGLDAPYRMAIEFDRKGHLDVIANHGASKRFAKRLARILGMRVSNEGVFTDIAVLDAIRERVNLSVGYFSAHSPDEYLDTRHLYRLLNTFKARWKAIHALPCQPRPMVDEPVVSFWSPRSDGPVFKTHSWRHSLHDDNPCQSCGNWDCGDCPLKGM